MIQLAVNYSRPAAALSREGRIAFDRFKCPAWPDVVAESLAIGPSYVHYPILVGGARPVIDKETGADPDWGRIESMARDTGVPYINIHLAPTNADHPEAVDADGDPDAVRRFTDYFIDCVGRVVSRFGPARVILENNSDDWGQSLTIGILPGVIAEVVAATGCGFLLDISHARLAAERLGWDARDYTEALPVGRIRELHVTGVQRFDESWIRPLREAGIPEAQYREFIGHRIDHLPLTDDCWDFYEWSIGRIRSGAWSKPWAVAYECGGVSPLWEALTDADVLAEQVPRLLAALR